MLRNCETFCSKDLAEHLDLMRIIHLTPGTGSFHCGSCLRDNALIKALRKRGHEALMVPLYLPLVTDDEPASPELEVQVGGINLYLHERLPLLARALPGPVRRFFDHHSRLHAASRWVGMTSPRDLGRMTLGSLRGKDGNQAREWQKLIDWLATSAEGPPDLISLSNSLLAGLVPIIHERLGCPVIVSLQGEDAFLDTLPAPYREQCWSLLARLAGDAEALVAPSEFYAAHMANRLGMNQDDIAVVPDGLDWTNYTPSRPPPLRQPSTVGYLGRMIEGKGLGNLIDAFLLLRTRGSVPELRLHLAGATTSADRPYLEALRRRVMEAGACRCVRWSPNIDFQEKVDFLHSITVFSMPAPASYGEAFGLPVVEAMACGAPVVEPDNGAYPEIIRSTGGGLLFPVDDIGLLADQIERILLDPELRDRLATRGAEAVRGQFSAARSAAAFEATARACITGADE